MRSSRILTVLSLVTLAACESPVSSETVQDAAAPTFLADLSAEEVDAIAADYDIDPDGFADAITAPFSCAPFEDLCEVVGEEAAEELVVAMLEDLRVGTPRDELLVNLQDRAAEARLDWEEELFLTGPGDLELRGKSATKTYTSAGGYPCYLQVEAKLVYMWAYTDHQAIATNICLSSFGVWTYSIVGSLQASLSSTRVSGSSTSSDSGSSTATNWYTASKSITMWGTGGAHTAKATGKVGGSSTSTGSSVSQSVTTSATF
jgi:hypothetical protein